MKFTRTAIPDVVICDPIVHSDERGYFLETFRQDKLEQFLGYRVSFLQDNESKSNKLNYSNQNFDYVLYIKPSKS